MDARILKKLSGFSPDQQPPAILPLDYSNAELYLYVTSKVERTSRAFSCRKEPLTVGWLDGQVRPGDVVYDIGANVGAYALIAASRCAPGGRVVAFEPSYASFAHLCDNIVLNNLSTIIIPIPLPLGDESALATLNYHRLYPGHARHSAGTGDTDARGESPVYRQPVLLARLDDLVRQFSLPVPRLIKMDVDGAEVRVLRGARALLQHPSLEEILTEIDVHNSDAMMELLTAARFELVDRHQNRREDGTLAPLWSGRFRRLRNVAM